MYVRELVVSYRRREIQIPTEGRLLATPQDAASVFISVLGEEAVEVFGILCLTTKHQLIAYHQVSRGSIDRTPVSPREVFQVALLANAPVIVVGHNHPSGDPMPSSDDIALTRKLTQAGELIGVEVIDHLIIGDGRHYSFREGGRL